MKVSSETIPQALPLPEAFHDGKWRLLKDDGSGLVGTGLFDKGCGPPVEGQDEVWEAWQHGWRRKVAASVRTGICPKCGSPGKSTGTEGVWFCENMHKDTP